MSKAGIRRAMKRCGGGQGLSDRMGAQGTPVSRQVIYKWLFRGYVPGANAINVERASGEHRHYLNGKLYPEKPPADWPESPNEGNRDASRQAADGA